jgi:hypothetical protein
LHSGDGEKWVYAQFKDTVGNVSSAVSDAIILDTTPPTDGILTAIPAAKSIALNWSGFGDSGSGIQTYQLYTGTNGFPDRTNGTKIYDGPLTSFTHNGLQPGRTYYYRVYAIDRAANISSGAIVKSSTTGNLSFLSLLLAN